MLTDQLKLKMKHICDKNNEFYPLFDALVKINKSVVSTEELLRAIDWGDSDRPAYASNKLAVDFLRELQQEGVGKFVVGRKAKKSRFIWNLMACDLAQKTPESIETNAIENAASSEMQKTTNPFNIVHQFVLRTDFVARFELPRDLTKNEADRLARFCLTLPLENP